MSLYKPNAEYTHLLLDEYNRTHNKNNVTIQEAGRIRTENALNEEKIRIANHQARLSSDRRKPGEFKSNVKESLLKEAIYTIYNESLPDSLQNYNESIKRNLVDQFVVEEGTDELLRRFKTKSYLLSELALIVEECTQEIFEEAESTSNFDTISNQDAKDSFFKKIEGKDIGAVSSIIRHRVANTIDEFLTDNAKDQIKIKETLQKTKQKIDSLDTEDEGIKESYSNIGKARVSYIQSNRPKTIFESMVYNLSDSVFKNDTLKEMYLKNNDIDIESVVETCRVIYTMLETVNTTKMKNIDESYIDKILKSLN